MKIGENLIKFDAAAFCLHVTELFLFTMAACILMAAVLFTAGGSVGWYLLPAGFAAASAALYILSRNEEHGQLIIEIVFTILVFSVLTYIAGRFYDLSYDGNAYHKMAVGLLKEHWNPLECSPSDFNAVGRKFDNIWVETYCKGTWIFGAAVYAITGSIENGKVYNLMGMLCAFLISFYFLKKKKKNIFFCIVFSLAAALNPIAVQQFRTYYVDGFLHIILYVLIISLIMGLDEDEFDIKHTGALIFASMIICGNIKFTGLLYGGIFCMVFFLLKSFSVRADGEKDWLRKRGRIFLSYAALAVITVFLGGNTSYLTNYRNHGSFTYPLTGSHPVDIITANSPFSDVNHFRNLFVSLFSRLDNFTASTGRSAVLKIPFSVDWEHERHILNGVVDPRLSGFGIFFSGILLLSVTVIVIKLITMKKNRNFAVLLTGFLTCIGLTFAISSSWWARYCPYIYFIVLMALYILMDADRKFIRVIFGAALSAMILINNCLFLYPINNDLEKSRTASYAISSLGRQKIRVITMTCAGVYFNLKDKNVSYIIDKKVNEDGKARKLGYMDILYKYDD